MDLIKTLFRQASKGLHIFGETRMEVARELLALSKKTGFEKVDGFFRMLHMLSVSTEKSFISDNEMAGADRAVSDRLIEVISFIKNNLHESISLQQVADIACMTIPSFCRFFKSRTKMRFSQFLLEERLEYAQKLLIEVDKPISDIAGMCGYSSNSHFCKVFKDYTGQSPYQYKTAIVRMVG